MLLSLILLFKSYQYEKHHIEVHMYLHVGIYILSTTTAMLKHKVAIGCQSGQFIFLKFDEDARPFG